MATTTSASTTARGTGVRGAAALAYGAVAYLLFLGSFTYTIGFLAGLVVPRGIDDGPVGPVWVAVTIDAALLGLFAVQHTVMARPAFKRWWTRYVPVAVERSTFVLAASLVLSLLLWQWRPLPETVWSIEAGWARAAVWTVYGLGWVTVVGSTYLIDHFDLFGLKQVVARARGRPHVPPGFRQPLLYAFIRHPIMVGFLLAFWAAPDASWGRLLFAVLGTGYILVGVRFEERDMVTAVGEPYVRYAAEVPRFVPRLRRRRRSEPVDERRDVAQA
jgi:methanethiol S-methyltransferase